MKKPAKRTMTELADAAFEQAALKVIARAKASGNPIIVWENGEVKKLSPQEAIEGMKKAKQRKASG